MSTSDRRVLPEDLLRFRIPGDVQLSPDAMRAAWTERYVDSQRMKTYQRLVGGELRAHAPLTTGDHHDGAPRFSPDGRLLAFVRTSIDDRDRVAQLCVYDFASKSERVLVEREGSFGAPAWSPDGVHVAFALRLSDAVEEGESGPLAIDVDRMHYKLDGVGYLPRDRFSLFRVRVADEAPPLERLTADGDWDDTEPVYAPDGTRIAFMSGRRETRSMDFEHRDLFVMPADGGEAKQLTEQRMYAFGPAWGPDGSWLLLCACPGKPFSALFLKNVEVWQIEADGSDARSLTDGTDRCTMNLTIDDIWGLEHWEQAPMVHDTGVLFPLSDEGTTWLAQVSLDHVGRTSAVEPVVDDVVVITTSIAAAAGKMLMLTTSATEPGQVVLANLDGTSRETIAAPFEDYLAGVTLATPIELRVERPDAQVHGWLALPEGDGPHPLLLSIHGGPIVQYGANFFHEIQCQVAAGFAVLFVNPRGSQGYGAEWAAATHRDWATKPMADLLAAVDWAVENHPIDTERMGVLGGSYGGYMTTWIVAHDHRFKASCIQRTVSKMDGLFWGDFGSVLRDEIGAWPWEEPEQYERMSPLTHVANIETPMLIMQGLSDMRTPPDQGERQFLTMKAMGKDVEMVLFPGASHGLSRGGQPRQRLERLRRIEAWFRKHLLVAS